MAEQMQASTSNNMANVTGEIAAKKSRTKAKKKHARNVPRTQATTTFSAAKLEELYQQQKAGGFVEVIKSDALRKFIKERRAKDEGRVEGEVVGEEVEGVVEEMVEEEVGEAMAVVNDEQQEEEHEAEAVNGEAGNGQVLEEQQEDGVVMMNDDVDMDTGMDMDMDVEEHGAGEEVETSMLDHEQSRPAVETEGSKQTKKRFFCTVPGCKKSYVTKGGLERHMSSHSTEKAFKCSQCSYASHRKDLLDSHVRAKHASNKLVPGMLVLRASDLSRALDLSTIQSIQSNSSSTTSKLHKCLCCSYRFAETSDLFEHIRSQHQDDLNKTPGSRIHLPRAPQLCSEATITELAHNLTDEQRKDVYAFYPRVLEICLEYNLYWSELLNFLSLTHASKPDPVALLHNRLRSQVNNMGPFNYAGSSVAKAHRQIGPEFENGQRIRKLCCVLCRESGVGVFGPVERARQTLNNLILANRYTAFNPGYDGIIVNTRLARRATDAMPRGGGQTQDDQDLNMALANARMQWPNDIIQIDMIFRGPDAFMTTMAAWNSWAAFWMAPFWGYRFNIMVYQLAPNARWAAHPFFATDTAWSQQMGGLFSIAPLPASPIQAQSQQAQRLFDLSYEIAQTKMDGDGVNQGQNRIV